GMRVRGRSEPRVVELVADSPAERAGIRIGDVLRSIDGTAIDDEVDFYFEMLSKTADQPVRFTLLRDGRQVELSVRLRPLPKPDGAALARRRLGLELRELGPTQARRLGLQLRGVLLVAGLEAGGPAARLGARRGDILWQVGRFRISSLDEVGQVLSAVRSGDLLYLGFVRISGVAVYQFGGQVEAR
ncbi:MAG: PDZ domain-containing protein, partial [Phycisphaerae bacterium]